MSTPILDSRTTPGWLRVPALVGLGAVGIWFGVCYRFALANLGVAEPPAALAAHGDLFWLGRWRMFTDQRPMHTDLTVEALGGGSWAWVDLEALYPSDWSEGPGYLRDDLLENPQRLKRLAQDACRRVAGVPERLRFTKVTWPKTLGQMEQPRVGAFFAEILDHRCGDSRAGGRDGE